jgi:diguanylate cyclase (GGDEF)-like protein/PAS domain S-box-containing protein
MPAPPTPPASQARLPPTRPAGALAGTQLALQLARAVDHAANPILIVDRAARIVWTNRAYAALIGRPAQALLGRVPASLRPSRDTAKFYARLWASLLEGQTWIGDLSETTAAGRKIEMETVISPMTDAAGRPSTFLVLQHDVTDRNAEYRTLYKAANHDRLTDLPNRGLFTSLFEHSLDRARRSNKFAALLYIDLDGFKAVNDTHGHDAGDRVLVESARLLTDSIRRSDVAARIGGDEFCCLLTDLDDPAAAGRVAQQIVDAIRRPMTLEGVCTQIGASIGVAAFPIHGTSMDELRLAADQAMYIAKRSGKNAWCMASPPEPKD